LRRRTDSTNEDTARRMNYRPLGKTGLNVSVLGLGTGTRFGDPKQHSASAAARLVRAALDSGVNYIDTAAMYLEAEAWLGEALASVPRGSFVLATKFFPADATGRPISPAELRTSVETSLRRLRLDTIDVLQIHGLRPHWFGPVMDTLGAELETLQRAGRFRFLGVAETIIEDPRHEMLPAAAKAGRFDAALVAYNLLSPWAEIAALPAARHAAMGVVAMVAVRRALRDPEWLGKQIRAARERGEPALAALPDENPLDWLLDDHTPDLPSAGYRFAISHPAVSSVLAGTLNVEHLRANIAAACAPPMSPEQLARIRSIFLQTDPAQWKPGDL
jgi:L-galactose dehydrogenase